MSWLRRTGSGDLASLHLDMDIEVHAPDVVAPSHPIPSRPAKSSPKKALIGASLGLEMSSAGGPSEYSQHCWADHHDGDDVDDSSHEVPAHGSGHVKDQEAAQVFQQRRSGDEARLGV